MKLIACPKCGNDNLSTFEFEAPVMVKFRLEKQNMPEILTDVNSIIDNIRSSCDRENSFVPLIAYCTKCENGFDINDDDYDDFLVSWRKQL